MNNLTISNLCTDIASLLQEIIDPDNTIVLHYNDPNEIINTTTSTTSAISAESNESTKSTKSNEIVNSDKTITLHTTNTSNCSLMYRNMMFINITIPSKYSTLPDAIFEFDNVSNLTKLSYDDILNYFRDLLNENNNDKNRDILITNASLYQSTMTFEATLHTYSDSARRCDNCKCMTKTFTTDINTDIDNDNMVVCIDCYEENININVNDNDEINKIDKISEMDKEAKFSHTITALQCDICNSVIMYAVTISSNVYDIDLCPECAKTEKGLELINKYDMKEYPNLIIHSNHTFGSILDWIPIYTDNNNSYITVCLNENNPLYHCIAIAHKNCRGNYEYTIMNTNELNTNDDATNVNIHNICNELKSTILNDIVFNHIYITEQAIIDHIEMKQFTNSIIYNSRQQPN